MYEFTGKIRSIGAVKQFSGGFTKREFVVDEDRDSQWPNTVMFVLTKDRTSRLDGVKIGEHVKLSFAIDGREWNDPNTGRVRNFTDLTVLKIERLGGADAAPAANQPAQVPAIDSEPLPADDEEDMPF